MYVSLETAQHLKEIISKGAVADEVAGTINDFLLNNWELQIEKDGDYYSVSDSRGRDVVILYEGRSYVGALKFALDTVAARETELRDRLEADIEDTP